MHAITDLADTWERLGNALDSTPPFPKSRPRIRLAAPLLPIVVAAYYTTPYMLTKVSGFLLGFLLFGKPLLDRAVQLLERTHPRWQRFVELRHSVLRGVPTNAQLTITLLRIGEKNKAPIPAPPDPDAVAGKPSSNSTETGVYGGEYRSESSFRCPRQLTVITCRFFKRRRQCTRSCN